MSALALAFPDEIAGHTDARLMRSLLVTGFGESNRVMQILSAFDCRFLGGILVRRTAVL
jgi:hypothetical protein